MFAKIKKLFSKGPGREDRRKTLSLATIEDRPFWEDLPSLGPDTQDIIEMIKRAYPVATSLRDPYNIRRKLYVSILRFRTGDGRKWLLDEKIVVKRSNPTALNRALSTV